MVLFFISLVLGFLLIVLQVNDDSGYDGEAVTMLSGEVIPAIQETPDQIQEEQKTKSWVHRGKTVFFFLSIFLVVFWVKLSAYGLPKEWWDKGYSLLVIIFAFAEAGKHGTHAYQDFVYGDYLNMAGHASNMALDFYYIKKPCFLSLLYAGFIYWVLRGHKMFDTSWGDE